ncbi:MAG TPA: glucoamylase family protein [Bryobacteraceae bacterium]|nr:glucoamylase family protein [Bryobacteraceae bacterium]
MKRASVVSKAEMPPTSHPAGSDAEMLDGLQRATIHYFLKEFNPENGLIADTNRPGAPASIAVTGLGISVYIVAVERGVISRSDAVNKVLKILQFFDSSRQSPDPDATGYNGFYYHFLDIQTGRRADQSELSTIDTAMLIAGILHASTYFAGDQSGERKIRKLAAQLYRRVNWQWALNGAATLSHGWKPESGFLPSRWDCGYSEALILYILAAGSPSFPIEPEGYREWLSSFEIKTAYGLKYIYAGPLFIHQLSHMWIDFRGIRDAINRKSGIDYFENSRRATYVQRQYAIDNPRKFAQYGEYAWGLTASDGPGPAHRKVDGRDRTFYGYLARGAPLGPDDGTISPWAVAASIPFAPEIVIDTLRHVIERFELQGRTPYGLDASFNPTFPEKKANRHGWVSPWIFGLNQAPIVLMIENFQSALIWQAMRRCPHIRNGLRRLGFRGPQLEAAEQD